MLRKDNAKKVNNSLFLLLLTLVVTLILLSPMLCQAEVQQTKNPTGYLKISRISVERINLAVKEIDVKVSILEADVNCPFNITIWKPVSYSAHGKPDPIDPSWYYFREEDWLLRSVPVKTIGFLGVNTFPYEYYETEIIFGFSITRCKEYNTFDLHSSFLGTGTARVLDGLFYV